MNAIPNSNPSVTFGGDDRLLRLTVRLDAWLSGAFGVVLLATGGLVGGPLGIPPTALGAIGAVCLIYAGTLWLLQARPLIPAAAGWAVIGANCVWVAASVLLVLLGWLPLTPLGIGCALLQALAVCVLADMQWLAVRRA